MENNLQELLIASQKHRELHKCGGYPYLHTDMLCLLLRLINAKEMLELGTGIGYSSAVMAVNSNEVHIDTIDQDDGHLKIAEKNWKELEVAEQITPFFGKAEAVLPQLSGPYDLIFFDGHTPSLKFLMEFERLLKKDGVLVTANMFLRDETGGKYMRALQKIKKWKTATFSDTTIAIKLF